MEDKTTNDHAREFRRLLAQTVMNQLEVFTPITYTIVSGVSDLTEAIEALKHNMTLQEYREFQKRDAVRRWLE